ncbi:hypothetical protein ISCGN_004564 [Ixodes scapularis]
MLCRCLGCLAPCFPHRWLNFMENDDDGLHGAEGFPHAWVKHHPVCRWKLQGCKVQRDLPTPGSSTIQSATESYRAARCRGTSPRLGQAPSSVPLKATGLHGAEGFSHTWLKRIQSANVSYKYAHGCTLQRDLPTPGSSTFQSAAGCTVQRDLSTPGSSTIQSATESYRAARCRGTSPRLGQAPSSVPLKATGLHGAEGFSHTWVKRIQSANVSYKYAHGCTLQRDLPTPGSSTFQSAAVSYRAARCRRTSPCLGQAPSSLPLKATGLHAAEGPPHAWVKHLPVCRCKLQGCTLQRDLPTPGSSTFQSAAVSYRAARCRRTSPCLGQAPSSLPLKATGLHAAQGPPHAWVKHLPVCRCKLQGCTVQRDFLTPLSSTIQSAAVSYSISTIDPGVCGRSDASMPGTSHAVML